MAERAQKAVKKSEAKKASRISHTQYAELLPSMDSPENRILYLQRTAGNRAVQNLIKSGAFQAKLRIGRPNDIYEQEADRVADSVMKMPEPQAVINSDGGHLVRRACTRCEEELRRQPEEGPIQPSAISEQITPLAQRQTNEEYESVQTERHPGGNQEVPQAPESQIKSLSGRGQSLSESVRAFFEPRFAYNFSHVRVHTGSGAADAARSVNAKAFTVGNNIFFGAGHYSPETGAGKNLLAHELTHVVQQKGNQNRIQRKTDQIVECIRGASAAQVCLVHLHRSEEIALKVAKDLYTRYCANLVYIKPNGKRLIKVDVSVDVRGRKGRMKKEIIRCGANPNGIFSKENVENEWESWNKDECPKNKDECLENKCLKEPYRSKAIKAVTEYGVELKSVIEDHCRKTSLPPPLPTFALHNYRSEEGELLGYFRSGGKYNEGTNRATALPGDPIDEANLIHIYDFMSARPSEYTLPQECKLKQPATRPTDDCLKKLNPYTPKGVKHHDFFLVTRKEDFLELASQRRNVVLQAANPSNDGSLSWLLKNERYFTLEVWRNRGMEEYSKQAEAVLSHLSISQKCPAKPEPPSGCNVITPGSGSLAHGSAGGTVSSSTPITTPSSSTPITTPSPKQVQPSFLAAPEIRSRIPVQIQRDLSSADLRRLRNAERDRFMRRVYDFQVQLWTSQGARYTWGIPASELQALPSRDTMPGRRVMLHRDILNVVQRMLNDARSALNSAKAAGEAGVGDVTDIRVRSGYRSAREQFGIWERFYPEYYSSTRAHRRTLPGGEHGEVAARDLAEYINERVFSAGYSPHQKGQTIDLTYNEKGMWAEADTSEAGIRMWRSSWLFSWVLQNGPRYGFVQNPRINEPWHWEYDPGWAFLTLVFRWLRDLLMRVLSLFRMGEEPLVEPTESTREPTERQ